MAERSATSLHWLLVTLFLWGLTRLLPATGTRRKTPTATRTAVTSRNAKDHAPPAAQVPAQRRSPYSTDRGALDGSASRLSRPYLPALTGCWAPEEAAKSPRTARVRPCWTARERALRWKRRRVLVLAAHFRLDLDRRDIYAVPAGSGVR
ncbi:hypothetical protein [Streptomyces sp. GQFP]|uniref:hypothetical protein n=1 Tax=Streptomyces sp. GQFP TaxID=2907545 RepID=UPI001F473730|nr:hypothetical protein [Streptomyces sp. GQFP]UIX32988.1 hypothetical protein LUX31_24890 [Streptomyces sp. GQFP]